jgi:hypothetical protein
VENGKEKLPLFGSWKMEAGVIRGSWYGELAFSRESIPGLLAVWSINVRGRANDMIHVPGEIYGLNFESQPTWPPGMI